MPHFAAIREESRIGMKDAIEALLANFISRGFTHSDVQWRNIGYYIRGGEKVPVLYDLGGACSVEGRVGDFKDWVSTSLMSLFSSE